MNDLNQLLLERKVNGMEDSQFQAQLSHVTKKY